jgi:hypothetical protein
MNLNASAWLAAENTERPQNLSSTAATDLLPEAHTVFANMAMGFLSRGECPPLYVGDYRGLVACS